MSSCRKTSSNAPDPVANWHRQICFGGHCVQLQGDSEAGLQLSDFLFSNHYCDNGSGDCPRVEITQNASSGLFIVVADGQALPVVLDRRRFLAVLLETVQYLLLDKIDSGPVIHCAASAYDGTGILLPGVSGAGKTTLVTWLAGNGYELLSDELVHVEQLRLSGFCRPLNIKSWGAGILEDFPWISSLRDKARPYDAGLWIPWESSTQAPVDLRAVVFPAYREGVAFNAHGLSPARGAMGLMQCLLNASNLPRNGLPAVRQLVDSVPCYRLEYSRLSDASDWLRSKLQPDRE